jgi:hypothetical protein
LVGLLVRPTGGLVDLASGTLSFVSRYCKWLMTIGDVWFRIRERVTVHLCMLALLFDLWCCLPVFVRVHGLLIVVQKNSSWQHRGLWY